VGVEVACVTVADPALVPPVEPPPALVAVLPPFPVELSVAELKVTLRIMDEPVPMLAMDDAVVVALEEAVAEVEAEIDMDPVVLREDETPEPPERPNSPE